MFSRNTLPFYMEPACSSSKRSEHNTGVTTVVNCVVLNGHVYASKVGLGYNGQNGGVEMAGVYYQVKTEVLADAVQCGLKLSEHADREIFLPGEAMPRRFMTAWLHPEDLPLREPSDSGHCLRLEIDPSRCYVGDAHLYRMGLLQSELKQRYLETLVPLKAYRFGGFRLPECLVGTSVLDSQIAVMGAAMDAPVLYKDSATLYLQTRMAEYEEICGDGGNALLYAWCTQQETIGTMRRHRDKEGKTEVFLSNRTGSTLVLEVPPLELGKEWP